MDRNTLHHIICYNQQVRLVRACGSKLISMKTLFIFIIGQARKSLWIETPGIGQIKIKSTGQARKSLWIETIYVSPISRSNLGQARKSLWIETF